MYPLTKLENPFNKESIDKISSTFYYSLTHVPTDEISNPFY